MAHRLPDFIIIGAMKAGTSSLHEQLRLRSGIFMSTPKEPNFFSDDPNYDRGVDWYASLFAEARPGQICGESSTHYTKLPTFPLAASRMKRVLPHVKLVYLMRDPIERIVSQYIHEWTRRETGLPLTEVVCRDERYLAYSSYARQLAPYLDTFGPDRVLPVALEYLHADPNGTFARICEFLGDPTPDTPVWRPEADRQNVSSARLRTSRLRDALRQTPGLEPAVRKLPDGLRRALRRPWQMQRRPTIPESVRKELSQELDLDLARLSALVGRPLSCDSWSQEVSRGPLAWSGR